LGVPGSTAVTQPLAAQQARRGRTDRLAGAGPYYSAPSASYQAAAEKSYGHWIKRSGVAPGPGGPSPSPDVSSMTSLQLGLKIEAEALQSAINQSRTGTLEDIDQTLGKS